MSFSHQSNTGNAVQKAVVQCFTAIWKHQLSMWDREMDPLRSQSVHLFHDGSRAGLWASWERMKLFTVGRKRWNKYGEDMVIINLADR
jgi:hypothetical protein